ncbi:MAG: hypothetical protein WBB69_05935 [Anaerolineales bacterium]
MKRKSISLLLIFLISLLPFNIASAEDDLKRDFYNTLSLMYFSDAILENQTDLDQVHFSPGLFAYDYNILPADPDDAALAASIHAAKTKRNNLDAECSLLISQHQAKGENCEADRLKETCAQKREKINAEIGSLHKKRGDKRRPLTKLWHRIKRGGKSFWYRIGPRGRNFLRKAGPEALEAVATGGVSGLKTLAKQYIKSISRKKLILHGIERILVRQMEIMQAAGLDICDPEKESEQAEKPKEPQEVESKVFKDGTLWQCEDVAGRISGLKAQEGVDCKMLKGKLDLSISYNEKGQVLHVSYAIDVAQEWGVWQEDGSLGDWHEVTTSFNVEDTAVDFSNENGYFQVTFFGDEHRSDSMLNFDGNVPFKTSVYGLIPASNWEFAYFCDVGANLLPTLDGSITADNFQELCRGYYYECTAVSK